MLPSKASEEFGAKTPTNSSGPRPTPSQGSPVFPSLKTFKWESNLTHTLAVNVILSQHLFSVSLYEV